MRALGVGDTHHDRSGHLGISQAGRNRADGQAAAEPPALVEKLIEAVRSIDGITALAWIAARLSDHVTLEGQADGNVVARFEGYAQGLGKFTLATLKRLPELRTGLPFASMAHGRAGDKEINLLVQRLARSGLLEYRLGPARGGRDSVVIEPQLADYSPQISKIGNNDTIALSRFAYLRRRGTEMVLESPRAVALFRIADPKIAAAFIEKLLR